MDFMHCFTPVIIILMVTLKAICDERYMPDGTVKAICQIGTTSDGLQLANCSRPYTFVYFVNDTLKVAIPPDLPSTIEVLDLSNRGGFEMSYVYFISKNQDETVLENYLNLKRFIQRNSEQFKSTGTSYTINPLGGQWLVLGQRAMFLGFTVLDSLEYFELSNSAFYNELYPIHFPKNIKTLNMSENNLTSLDLKPCSQLEEVNLNWNMQLESPPTFHIPTPPIKTLRMKGCPLTKMTILDIAPLCELTLLELQFPSGTHYLSEAGYCQCVMLKRWLNLVDLKGVENFNCKELTSTKSCPEDIFIEAQALHKKCPLLGSGTISKKLLSILKYLFFLIIFLLLLATLILYIIRHFHLKEYWAAHHLRMAATVSPKMEEEEEEPLSDQSSSISNYSMLSMK